MSIELFAISSFVVAMLAGLAQFAKKSNLKQCRMCCIDSDCRNEDKATNLKMKELNDKIMKNEKKIVKNKTKLEEIKNKRRLSNVPDTPVSGASENSLSEVSVFDTPVSEASENSLSEVSVFDQETEI